MYEFEIAYKGSNERHFIYGYSFKDACRRRGLNPDKFMVISTTYLD